MQNKKFSVWSYLLMALLVLMGLSAVFPVFIASLPDANLLPIVAVSAGLFWTLPCFAAAVGVAKRNRTVLMILMVIGGLGILQSLAALFMVGGSLLTYPLSEFREEAYSRLILDPLPYVMLVYILCPLLLFFLAYKEDQRLKSLKP